MEIKNLKFKSRLLHLLGIIFLVVIVFYSTNWVIAQTSKPKVITNKPAAVPAEPVVSAVDQYSIGIGRSDPFMPVTGAPSALIPGVSGPEAGVSEGASGGVILTGILFVDGRRAVILKMGTKSFIAKLGEKKFGYYVKKIGRKNVVLSTKSGDITVPLVKESFLKKAESPVVMPGETELVPPAMQTPVPVKERTTEGQLQITPQEGPKESPQSPQ